MIEITINCNDDTMRVTGRRFDYEIKLNRPREMIRLLEIMFKEMDEEAPLSFSLDTRLIEIDEDIRTIVGEW